MTLVKKKKKLGNSNQQSNCSIIHGGGETKAKKTECSMKRVQGKRN